jgi:hypothetical protein
MARICIRKLILVIMELLMTLPLPLLVCLHSPSCFLIFLNLIKFREEWVNALNLKSNIAKKKEAYMMTKGYYERCI